MQNITLYGAGWCADCKRSRKLLDETNTPYEFIDIDTVPGAADKVAEINDGLKRIPTIVFSDGSVLIEPSNQQLADHLNSR